MRKEMVGFVALGLMNSAVSATVEVAREDLKPPVSVTARERAASGRRPTLFVNSSDLYPVPPVFLGDGVRSEVLITNAEPAQITIRVDLWDGSGQSNGLWATVRNRANTLESSLPTVIQLDPSESVAVQLRADALAVQPYQIQIVPYLRKTDNSDTTTLNQKLLVSLKLSYVYAGKSGIESVFVGRQNRPSTELVPVKQGTDGEGAFLALKLRPYISGTQAVDITATRDNGSLLGTTKVTVLPGQIVLMPISSLFPKLDDEVTFLSINYGSSLIEGSAFSRSAYGIISMYAALDKAALTPTTASSSACAPWLVPETELYGCFSAPAGKCLTYTFIGAVDRDAGSARSIANPNGAYGSPIGASSIFNRDGTYGSNGSEFSPWNASASMPPQIRIKGATVGILTRNASVSGTLVAPDLLVSCVGRTR